MTPGGLNVIGLARPDGEYYWLVYDDSHYREARVQVGRWAASPELAFDFHDADMLLDQMDPPVKPRKRSWWERLVALVIGQKEKC